MIILLLLLHRWILVNAFCPKTLFGWARMTTKLQSVLVESLGSRLASCLPLQWQLETLILKYIMLSLYVDKRWTLSNSQLPCSCKTIIKDLWLCILTTIAPPADFATNCHCFFLAQFLWKLWPYKQLIYVCVCVFKSIDIYLYLMRIVLSDLEIKICI